MNEATTQPPRAQSTGRKWQRIGQHALRFLALSARS
jgi:hypothetical protein